MNRTPLQGPVAREFRSADVVTSGSRITYLREERGISLEELAWRVGLLVGVLKAVESGRRGVTYECLIDIANELGVTASELVDGME